MKKPQFLEGEEEDAAVVVRVKHASRHGEETWFGSGWHLYIPSRTECVRLSLVLSCDGLALCSVFIYSLL